MTEENGYDEKEAPYDPFEKAEAGSEDGSTAGGVKESMSWSYSSYLQGLDKEEVLNEVDESTFSSLAAPFAGW